MRYVLAKFDEFQKGQAYRLYVSETLYNQGENKRLTVHYYDLLKPKETQTKTGDEIALDVIQRLGLKVE